MIAPAYSRRTLLLDWFHAVYKPERLADATPGAAMQYVFSINALSRRLRRPVKIADLTEAVLQDFVTASVDSIGVRGKPLSPVTINNTVNHLMTLARYAKRKKLLDEVPEITLRKVKRRQPRAWMHDEMEKIIIAAREAKGAVSGVPRNRWWPALILFSYDTGLRLSAALDTKFSEIDLKR